jgi:membrane protein
VTAEPETSEPETSEPATSETVTFKDETTRGIGWSLWRYVIRRALHGFLRHRGIDSAAALGFFSALSAFPTALSVVSVLALVDDRKGAVVDLLKAINTVAKESTVAVLAEPIAQFAKIPNPALGLVVGLILTLWSVSAYATAFGRAVNSVYEVQEGRQFWKFRGTMILLTLLLIVAFSAIMAILLITPRVIEAIGGNLGFGEPWFTIWNFGKWFVLAGIAVLVVAVLYFFTPNIRHPRFRWVSWGSVLAVVGWAIATSGFAYYAANISAYDKIYGWLGGAISLLLWLYITNLVLILGAELDAELARMRQLRAGLAAEEVILLPLRDSTRNLMLARQREEDVTDGRAVREKAVREQAVREQAARERAARERSAGPDAS